MADNEWYFDLEPASSPRELAQWAASVEGDAQDSLNPGTVSVTSDDEDASCSSSISSSSQIHCAAGHDYPSEDYEFDSMNDEDPEAVADQNVKPSKLKKATRDCNEHSLPPTPLLVPPLDPVPSRVLAPDTECGLFWDYENISLPKGVHGADASNCLRETCLRFGRLVERRVYHDPEKVNSVQLGNRSALDMAGFTLVDCPTRNLKETIDKKIIVDVMHFALTRIARHQPASIVLVSNDGDYAYMLSRLRDLQVHVVVIHRSGHAASDLLYSCDHALTWQQDVLRQQSIRQQPTMQQIWNARQPSPRRVGNTQPGKRPGSTLDEIVDSGCGMDGEPHPLAGRVECAQLKARLQAAQRKKAKAEDGASNRASRQSAPQVVQGGAEEGRAWSEDEDIFESARLQSRVSHLGRGRADQKGGKNGKKGKKAAAPAYGTAPFVRGGLGRKAYSKQRPKSAKGKLTKGKQCGKKGSKKGRR